MATTGLYSPHVNHPEKRIARNILLAVILILFALLTLFPIFYMKGCILQYNVCSERFVYVLA